MLLFGTIGFDAWPQIEQPQLGQRWPDNAVIGVPDEDYGGKVVRKELTP